MTDERWIVIPRWDEFQHRDMARSSVPPWIKNLTRLLGDEDYLALTLMQRGILHGLWMMYASHRRVLSESEARHFLCRSGAEARRWRDTMEALNHAGFIAIVAVRPARHIASEHASLEVEVEVEGLYKTPRSNGKGDSHRIETMISNGVIQDTVDLDAELAASTLTQEQQAFLRQLIPR